jgi:hypothetical protein
VPLRQLTDGWEGVSAEVKLTLAKEKFDPPAEILTSDQNACKKHLAVLNLMGEIATPHFHCARNRIATLVK